MHLSVSVCLRLSLSVCICFCLVDLSLVCLAFVRPTVRPPDIASARLSDRVMILSTFGVHSQSSCVAGISAAFWNVQETHENALVNMRIESRSVTNRFASTGIASSQLQPTEFKVCVMTASRALKQGEILYVKSWKPDASEKRKADDELDGVPVAKKSSKGKGKKGKSSSSKK